MGSCNRFTHFRTMKLAWLPESIRARKTWSVPFLPLIVSNVVVSNVVEVECFTVLLHDVTSFDLLLSVCNGVHPETGIHKASAQPEHGGVYDVVCDILGISGWLDTDCFNDWSERNYSSDRNFLLYLSLLAHSSS
ncbi:hypothetical protein WA026_023775 [Henosepilachna vigintioctopunctata]|uniref:Uncharacterized protein n=1 Tax=Henosepilachna vigintioctopunctata TaxID=420089 RepID=A0AAW1V6Z9_9CUCU